MNGGDFEGREVAEGKRRTFTVVPPSFPPGCQSEGGSPQGKRALLPRNHEGDDGPET